MKNLEEYFIADIIKEGKTIMIVFLDQETIHEKIKWFTAGSLGTESGKMVNRASIKYIQTELDA